MSIVEVDARLFRIRELVRSGEAEQIRKEAGISRPRIAEAVGVSVAVVANWEAFHT